MRKATPIGLIIVLTLSLMLTGTILAQDSHGKTETSTTWLGVGITETEDGVVIARISTNSPAEAGGLLVDDVVVSIDDQVIESADGLNEIIEAHQPGDVVAISVLRDGNENILEIELGTSPGRRSGDRVTDVDPLLIAERVLHVELTTVDNGYQVLDNRAHSKDTLLVNDIITTVNETPVTKVDWQTLLTELAGKNNPVLTLTVLRGDEEITLEIEQHGSTRDRHSTNDHSRPDRNNRGPSDTEPNSDDSADSTTL